MRFMKPGIWPTLLRTIVLACVLLSGFPLSGQRLSSVETLASRRTIPSPASRSSIRLDVERVLVPVTVTDPYEHVVEGLTKEDFRVFDEGTERPISEFYRDESPISVGIVFDASTSMLRRMDMSRRAISAFLARCMPDDEFFLIRFSNRPEQLQAFTRDVSLIEQLVNGIKPGGWTALYDAINLGMNQMRRAAYSNKVLLVLSDGGDNDSRYTEGEIKTLVQEGDARLYAISIFDRSATLQKLAESSGGRAYRIRKLNDLPDVATKISDELHSQYVLGYRPPHHPRDGKYRKVTVQLIPKPNAPPMRASWRRGYYGPSQ
jgi:Ca-activated chloride channel family protein